MEKRISRGIARLLLAVCLLLPLFTGSSVNAQVDVAQLIFDNLTVEQKVGQLFLVSFTGTNTGAESQIYDLITNYHIGGVILSRDRDNFTNDNTISNAKSLIYDLQLINYQKSINDPDKAHDEYIPLFVGISQEGGGYPNDQILSGLTPIPNQIALGATWDRDMVGIMGETLGSELSSIGFNLYYGLSLDVLTLNDPSINPDLTTRLFGGDPYWVGELGKRFTQGIHTGSNGKMLVVAKHFPGRGGSDRQADIEIPTIRKSLEDLQAIELAPFFAVTNPSNESAAIVDGLLVSHIRYQGFQGNIRATTKPISFDQQALGEVISLEPVLSWRSNGGLVVSDSLGTQAVRSFYDPDGNNFSARLIARDAFMAGSDLLQLGDIRSTGDPDNYTSVVNTLAYFVQRYNDDENFAERVDESVLRVLRKKLTFSEGRAFNSANINPSVFLPFDHSPNESEVFKVAKRSATLLSPSRIELGVVLPEPPQPLDYIIFISDTRIGKQCSTCDVKTTLTVDGFQNNVNKLYGPAADGAINPTHLSSFTFTELQMYLDGRLEDKTLEDALGRADWVVLSTQNMPEHSETITTLRRLLNDKQSLLSEKEVLLFSFDAPYYLDATDISKLTAYYNLYDPSPIFVNLAARILFQEVSPLGASPVSVEGIGYDLLKATSPDPTQIIKLSLSSGPPQLGLELPPITALPDGGVLLPGILETRTPILPPQFKIGDSVTISTEVILDRNQNQVPDGTPVEFNVVSAGEVVERTISTTVDGIASSVVDLDSPGVLEVSAKSEPAEISEIIRIDVSAEGSTVIIITPTPDVFVPTPTAPALEPTLEAVPTSTPSRTLADNGYPNLVGWFLLALIQLTGAFIAFILFSLFGDNKWSLRAGLIVLISGSLIYNFVILSNPTGLRSITGLNEYVMIVISGQLIGLAGVMVWRSAAKRGDKTDH